MRNRVPIHRAINPPPFLIIIITPKKILHQKYKNNYTQKWKSFMFKK